MYRFYLGRLTAGRSGWLRYFVVLLVVVFEVVVLLLVTVALPLKLPDVLLPSVLVPTGPVVFSALLAPMSPAGGSGEGVVTCSVAELVLAELLLLLLLPPPHAASASTLAETRAIEMVFMM